MKQQVAIVLCGAVSLASAGWSVAQEAETSPTPPPRMSDVQFTLSGGGAYRFETDFDDDGDFRVASGWGDFNISFDLNRELNLTLSAGYGIDSYNFDGPGGFGGQEPWGDIHSARIAAILRWKMSDRMTVIGGPSIGASLESGADIDDGLYGGGFGGFMYEVSDSLSIGPGVGIVSEIEDDVTVFPVVFVNWEIAKGLTLRTGGRSVGATSGPGIELALDLTDELELSIGGRYERRRFRLDGDDIGPDGVGEDESIPVYVSLSWRPEPRFELALIGGAAFGGEMTLEDEDGDEISSEDYDTSPFLGLRGSIRF